MQREGTDVTLVGFGRCVEHNLKAAAELEKAGISAEVSALEQPMDSSLHGSPMLQEPHDS